MTPPPPPPPGPMPALGFTCLDADDELIVPALAHDWAERGTEDDPWAECWLCGEVENR